jgi:L-aminopeptidase/D-esterase-like protein
LPAGPLNAITDVAGVRVGHVTLREGEDIRTGVTAIVPHPGNLFQEKVPAGLAVGNGFGKLTGVTLFLAAIEATEEAIYNSLFTAVTTTGYRGRTVEALPLDLLS